MYSTRLEEEFLASEDFIKITKNWSCNLCAEETNRLKYCSYRTLPHRCFILNSDYLKVNNLYKYIECQVMYTFLPREKFGWAITLHCLHWRQRHTFTLDVGTCYYIGDILEWLANKIDFFDSSPKNAEKVQKVDFGTNLVLMTRYQF